MDIKNMRNFRTFLAESKDTFAPWHETDPEKLKIDFMKRDLARFGWTEKSFEQFDTPKKLEEKFDDWHKYGDGNKGICFNNNGTITFKQTTIDVVPKWLIEESDGRTIIPFQIQSAKALKIWSNKLKSVWGAPLKCFSLTIQSNQLETLEHLNSIVQGSIVLKTPALKLFNCGAEAQSLWFGDGVDSLANIHKAFTIHSHVGFTIGKNVTKIPKSNMLGLMLIKGGMKKVYFNVGGGASIKETDAVFGPLMRVVKIINAHLLEDKDLLDCKEELMNSGYKEYAKL